jgi:hypothetical protein
MVRIFYKTMPKKKITNWKQTRKYMSSPPPPIGMVPIEPYKLEEAL